MFWVDKIVDKIISQHPDQEEFIIRDEKTLSGRVHVGSLRGVVIHGIVTQVLNERGKSAKFMFEFNDTDPMDGMPIYVDKEKYEPEMGKVLKNIPSPEPGYKNFAECYGAEFLGVINELGFHPKIVRASSLYEDGKMDEWIRVALENKDEIRKIYKEVSGSEKDDHWSPVHVICEKCGKVGTTDIKSFNGKEVEYVCERNKVTWAQGCEHNGSVSPFGGNATLAWKVEWPAKWIAYHVDIEGAGKDHNAAGGSVDVGRNICRSIFKTKAPFNIPYEFFLIGGKKMSSSKGSGATARAVADLLPPELLRFLMIRTEFKRPIEFEPEGETIPRLFDEHDKCAAEYFIGEESTFPDLGRAFELAQLNLQKKPTEKYLPRFSKLVFALQIPRLDLEEEVVKWKGSALTKEDKEELTLRSMYAKQWLTDYAPENYKFEVQENLPEMVKELSGDQKKALLIAAKNLKMTSWLGEEIHTMFHNLKAETGLSPREIFQAIYIPILGRDSGPQAGWLVSALEKEWVVERFEEVGQA